MRGAHCGSREFECCELNWTCAIGAGTSPVQRRVWTSAEWAQINHWSEREARHL